MSNLPHGLGTWVDLMLPPIAHAKDSFTLKTTLAMLGIPTNAQLFLEDARSMYTNIQTGPTLHHISQVLYQEDLLCSN